jgi:hypothetical protein
MTAENLLQECPSYSKERREIWEQPVTLREQLYGDAVNLELSTAFFKQINVSVQQRTLKKERKASTFSVDLRLEDFNY